EHFPAPGGFHPEERNRHGHGRAAQCRARNETSRPARARRSPDRPDQRQQRRWHDEFLAPHAGGAIARGLSHDPASHLLAAALLPARPDLPTRIPPAACRRAVQLAPWLRPRPIERAAGRGGTRTLPVLAPAHLDAFPPARLPSTGGDVRDLRPPLRQVLRRDRRLLWPPLIQPRARRVT